MNLATFRDSLASAEPPDDLNFALRALWFDAKGDWERAHDTTQADEGSAGAWVHAYLHRKEGDTANAAYWYNQARKPFFAGSLDAEWMEIATALLAERLSH